MGQLFYAVVYDIETRKCSVTRADKFYANCYSYSGAVLSAHYLLRQKAYNVLWGGDYVVIDDALGYISNNHVLLGISAYEHYDNFERSNRNLTKKPYYDRVKFIDENSKLWNRIDVWSDAVEFFEGESGVYSAEYSGFLLNHTQHLAIDLADYYELSQSSYGKDPFVVDPVPVLTETGGGTPMLLFDGMSAETTEELATTWRGDLLEIVDTRPDGFRLVRCCFAEAWWRARYLHQRFGVNDSGLVLKDRSGNLYEATQLALFCSYRDRNATFLVQAAKEGDEVSYSAIPREPRGDRNK